MARTFNLEKRLDRNSVHGILDVPHFAVLRYLSPEEIVQRFAETWKVRPDGVVLPLTDDDGLLFRVPGLDEKLSPYASISDDLKDFQSVVESFAKLKLGVYLLLKPNLSFLRSASLHVEDVKGQGSAALCLNNPRGQEVLAAIIGTGVDIVNETGGAGGLLGVVFDVVDLWGMGGSNKRLFLNCFCPSCLKYFEAAVPGLVKYFQDFPNPWNLLLQVTNTGINYVDEIGIQMKDEDIIRLSRQRGFCDVFKDRSPANLKRNADLLRQYIRARHDMTLLAINEVFKQAFDGLTSTPKRVLLMEGVKYGWTSGLQLDRLDMPEKNPVVPYDEIWFDPSSSDLFLTKIPFRSYMWTRGRYFIDAFFNSAAHVADPVRRATTSIARDSSAKLRENLRSRLTQALGFAMTELTALAALPDLQSESTESMRVGFVGVGFDRELGDSFVDSIVIPEGLEESEDEDSASDSEGLVRWLASQRAPDGGEAGLDDEVV